MFKWIFLFLALTVFAVLIGVNSFVALPLANGLNNHMAGSDYINVNLLMFAKVAVIGIIIGSMLFISRGMGKAD